VQWRLFLGGGGGRIVQIVKLTWMLFSVECVHYAECVLYRMCSL
jgi:hypothetical protein